MGSVDIGSEDKFKALQFHKLYKGDITTSLIVFAGERPNRRSWLHRPRHILQLLLGHELLLDARRRWVPGLHTRLRDRENLPFFSCRPLSVHVGSGDILWGYYAIQNLRWHRLGWVEQEVDRGSDLEVWSKDRTSDYLNLFANCVGMKFPYSFRS